jgi:hypothetical protein
MNNHTRSEIYLAIKELEDILDTYISLGIDEHTELFLGAIERLRELIV